jgi:hypothetical protein
MTRAIFTSFFLLGLACSATAQPAADASDAGWNECLHHGPTGFHCRAISNVEIMRRR